MLHSCQRAQEASAHLRLVEWAMVSPHGVMVRARPAVLGDGGAGCMLDRIPYLQLMRHMVLAAAAA